MNLEPKLCAFSNCLKQWHHRKLTLLGKITVIKTFALPKTNISIHCITEPSLTHHTKNN